MASQLQSWLSYIFYMGFSFISLLTAVHTIFARPCLCYSVVVVVYLQNQFKEWSYMVWTSFCLYFFSTWDCIFILIILKMYTNKLLFEKSFKLFIKRKDEEEERKCWCLERNGTKNDCSLILLRLYIPKLKSQWRNWIFYVENGYDL